MAAIPEVIVLLWEKTGELSDDYFVKLQFRHQASLGAVTLQIQKLPLASGIRLHYIAWTKFSLTWDVYIAWTHFSLTWGVYMEVLILGITESVDSVCRDGTDMPYVAIQTEAWKTLLKQQL